MVFYIDNNAAKTDVPQDGTPADCSADPDADTTDRAGCYSAIKPFSRKPRQATKFGYYPLYDLDGEKIDEGLWGNFMVNAKGTRGLFNEDDILFVDYDRNGMMGGSEEIVMGTGSALSIDADESESFPDGVTGTFKVYYMLGGKGTISHGSTITLTAMVDYSSPRPDTQTFRPTQQWTMSHLDPALHDGVGEPSCATKERPDSFRSRA